jgi:hypothetical protein
MKKILLTILLSLFLSTAGSAENEYELPKYSLVSTEVLEEVCTTKFGCAKTVKKEILSSDGFLFETYLTDNTDSVWCYNHFSEPNFPCSTIGDTGGGKNEMIIHNVEKKQKVKVINNSIIESGRITRVDTPLEYKFIVMEIHSGGMACCVSYEFYFKEDLSLKPFVIENSTSMLSITKKNRALLYLDETIHDHFRYQ